MDTSTKTALLSLLSADDLPLPQGEINSSALACSAVELVSEDDQFKSALLQSITLSKHLEMILQDCDTFFLRECPEFAFRLRTSVPASDAAFRFSKHRLKCFVGTLEHLALSSQDIQSAMLTHQVRAASVRRLRSCC